MLSGGTTPRESMPQFVQDIMLAAPTTHFVELGQAILYRGAGIDVVWKPFLALALIGTALFMFRWRFRNPQPDGLRPSIRCPLPRHFKRTDDEERQPPRPRVCSAPTPHAANGSPCWPSKASSAGCWRCLGGAAAEYLSTLARLKASGNWQEIAPALGEVTQAMAGPAGSQQGPHHAALEEQAALAAG